MFNSQENKDVYNSRRKFVANGDSTDDDYNCSSSPLECNEYFQHNDIRLSSPPPLEALPSPPSPPPLYPISELDFISEDSHSSNREHSSASSASPLSCSLSPDPYLQTDYGSSVSHQFQGYEQKTLPIRENQDVENSPSQFSSSNYEEGHTSSRRQKCSQCFNHGIFSEKKGHKRKCPFRECECEGCSITRGRQVAMKAQQNLNRKLLKIVKE